MKGYTDIQIYVYRFKHIQIHRNTDPQSWRTDLCTREKELSYPWYVDIRLLADISAVFSLSQSGNFRQRRKRNRTTKNKKRKSFASGEVPKPLLKTMARPERQKEKVEGTTGTAAEKTRDNR